MQRRNMVRRIVVMSGLLAGLAALSGCGGGGGRVAWLVQLSPQSVPKGGGPVQIILTAQDAELEVLAVEARVTGPNGFQKVVPLAAQPGEQRWSGEVTVPANTTAQDQLYTVIVTVQLRLQRLTLKSQTLTVTPAVLPPQVQASLNPDRIGFRGDRVTLNVAVTSPIQARIGEVTAQLSGPGLSTPQRVALSGEGGNRTGSVTLPPNSTNQEAVYTVYIQAKDVFGQTGDGQATATVLPASGEDRPPDPPE